MATLGGEKKRVGMRFLRGFFFDWGRKQGGKKERKKERKEKTSCLAHRKVRRKR